MADILDVYASHNSSWPVNIARQMSAVLLEKRKIFFTQMNFNTSKYVCKSAWTWKECEKIMINVRQCRCRQSGTISVAWSDSQSAQSSHAVPQTVACSNLFTKCLHNSQEFIYNIQYIYLWICSNGVKLMALKRL